MYLRRHWYKVLTDPPAIMTICCDRQAKNRKRPKARWWVYTIEAVGSDIVSERAANRGNVPDVHGENH